MAMEGLNYDKRAQSICMILKTGSHVAVLCYHYRSLQTIIVHNKGGTGYFLVYLRWQLFSLGLLCSCSHVRHPYRSKHKRKQRKPGGKDSFAYYSLHLRLCGLYRTCELVSRYLSVHDLFKITYYYWCALRIKNRSESDNLFATA